MSSGKTWESEQKCSWSQQYISFNFDEEVVISSFSFESPAGKQPITYTFDGSKDPECKNVERISAFNNFNLVFSARVKNSSPYRWYCFKIDEVSGYSPKGHPNDVEERTVRLENIKFRKSKK